MLKIDESKVLSELGYNISDFSIAEVNFIEVEGLLVMKYIVPEGTTQIYTKYQKDKDDSICGMCGHKIRNKIMIFSSKHRVSMLVGTTCAKRFGINPRNIWGLWTSKLQNFKRLLSQIYYISQELGFKKYIEKISRSYFMMSKIPHPFYMIDSSKTWGDLIGLDSDVCNLKTSRSVRNWKLTYEKKIFLSNLLDIQKLGSKLSDTKVEKLVIDFNRIHLHLCVLLDEIELLKNLVKKLDLDVKD